MKEPEILTIDAHCHLFNHEVLSWRLLVDFILSRMRPRGTRARLETALERASEPERPTCAEPDSDEGSIALASWWKSVTSDTSKEAM